MKKRNAFAVVVVTLLALVVAFAGLAMAQTEETALVIEGNAALESVQVVVAFTEALDPAYYAPDAEIRIGGRNESVVGQSAIADYLSSMYGGRGTVLGASVEPTRLIQVADNLVIWEYTYRGTAFAGNEFEQANMLAPVDLAIPMVSIYEVENGLITSEFVFEATGSASLAFADLAG